MSLSREGLEKELLIEFPERWACSFECGVDNITNIADSLLIINDFSSNAGPPQSFAFLLKPFLKDGKLPNRCWITTTDTERINRHPEYRDFQYNNKKFFGYSVQLDKYLNPSAGDAKKICKNIYEGNIKHPK